MATDMEADVKATAAAAAAAACSRVVQTHKHSAPYSSLSEATASTTAAAARLLLSTRC